MECAGTLNRAVAQAFAQARPGDVVLLAPACASFDQFENYEHRGHIFKQLVHELESKCSSASRSTGVGSTWSPRHKGVV